MTHQQRRDILEVNLANLSEASLRELVYAMMSTVLSYVDGDGDLDGIYRCGEELLDDLHNCGLDASRLKG